MSELRTVGMRIGSLFSGVCGLELGLEMAGLGETVWQVERDKFCSCVLAHHWPRAERFDDVCRVGRATLAPVDLICGGFPCQDVSPAGKGAGLAGERSGLWREFARVLGELQPDWAVVENVKGGAGRWLDAIVRELETLGYECLPVPVSARDVGAPHIRERLFVVAYADRVRELQPQGCEPDERRRIADGALADAAQQRGGQGLDMLCSGKPGPHDNTQDAANADGVDRESGRSARERDATPHAIAGCNSEVAVCGKCCRELVRIGLAKYGSLCQACAFDRDFADPDNAGREGPGPGEQEQGWARLAPHPGWPSEPGVVPLVHGLSGGMAGRKRRARIRALGNAVVPQCAEVVGWVIREILVSLARSSHPQSSPGGGRG